MVDLATKTFAKSCAKLMNRYIFERTVVIAAHNEDEPFDHGTGTLVQIGDERIVVTAAHVVRRHEPERLQIVGEERVSNLRSAPVAKEVLGGGLDDKLDVGFVRITPDLVARLHGKAFIGLEDIELFPVGVSQDLSLNFGMPEAAHQEEQEKFHRYDSFSFFTKVSDEFDWKSGKRRPLDIWMDFPAEVDNTFTGRAEALPNPKGMSGGGIWRAHFGGEEAWRPENVRLIGINSEFYEEKRQIRANRMEALVELLSRYFPRAAQYLEDARAGLVSNR